MHSYFHPHNLRPLALKRDRYSVAKSKSFYIRNELGFLPKGEQHEGDKLSLLLCICWIKNIWKMKKMSLISFNFVLSNYMRLFFLTEIAILMSEILILWLLVPIMNECLDKCEMNFFTAKCLYLRHFLHIHLVFMICNNITLKPWYSEQVRQTLFVHYIK